MKVRDEVNINIVSKTDGFTIIKSDKDLPTDFYDETKHVYLCVSASGKTTVCKYMRHDTQSTIGFWENAANYRDNISNVVAYKRIKLPKDVFNLCTGSGTNKKTVEYLQGLK